MPKDFGQNAIQMQENNTQFHTFGIRYRTYLNKEQDGTSWNHLKPAVTNWNVLESSRTSCNHLEQAVTTWNNVEPPVTRWT